MASHASTLSKIGPSESMGSSECKGAPLGAWRSLEVSCVTVLKTKEITGHAKRCVFCEGKLVLWQESGGYKPPIFTRICSFPTTNTDQTYTCWCLKILKGSPTILCNNLDPLLGGSFEIVDLLPLLTMDRENDPISKLGLQLTSWGWCMIGLKGTVEFLWPKTVAVHTQLNDMEFTRGTVPHSNTSM